VKSATVDYVVDCLIPFVAGAHWVLHYVKLMEVGIYIAVSGSNGGKVWGWANFQHHSLFFAGVEQFCCCSFRGHVPLILPLLDTQFF